MLNRTQLGAGVLVAALALAGCSVVNVEQAESPPAAEPAAPVAVEQAPAAEPAAVEEVAQNAAPQPQVETEAESAVDVQSGNSARPAIQPEPVAIDLPKLDNPLNDGEYRWNQLLARDAIFPVYDPTFAAADDAPYDDDELVIGVEINGQAKAYAIGPLNGREMVNDELGGIPILVTW